MSRRALAIETVKVCLWALSAATGATTVAHAEKAFSKVSGLAKFLPGNEPDAATRAAAALTAMLDDNPEFPDSAIATANALLLEKGGAIRTDAALLKAPEARRDFPAALYAHLFAKAPPPEDDRVDDLLRAVIAEAFTEFRKDATFHALFVQEGIIGIEGRLETMESRLIAAATLDVEDREELAALRTERQFLISIVQNFVPETGDDFAAAMANVTSALAAAARRLDLGAQPSNLGEEVDAIVAEVRALNHAGDTKGALARLREDTARRRAQRERQLAADGRVLDEAMAQAEFVNDAESYADFALERIRLDAPSVEDQFQQLRELFIDRYQTGLRTGAPFVLISAIGLARQCEGIAPTPYLRAMAQNDAAVALQNQGIRTEGAGGAALLAEAVATFDTALEVRTRQDHPVEWATTQNNKGIALQEQAIRTEGARGADLLAQAVAAYGAALEVRTREDHPVDWAMTQNNKGNALRNQGIRKEGARGAELLAEAVAAFDAALKVYTRRDHPVDWAMTQNNKGIALRNQGIRKEGARGAELLAEAVAAFDAAIEVYNRQDHPVQWAMTQENLAIAKKAWAEHDSAPDPRPLLTEALAHVDAALTVFDPEHMSYNHAKATRLRDSIRAKLDALP
ncbi:MAG: hypothetical protein AAFP13_09890 [Pseudomonadota bacterium]